MSHRTTLSAAVLLACTVAAAPLAAQQDTSMMQHDSTMMDQGSMSHDQMMDHDSTMGMDKGANMMFMGAAGQKAAGDYAITEAGGKQQLTLTDDFSVASGSDLYLVLANGDTPDKGAIWLGKLRHATGAQTYDLPKGKDLTKFTRLLVWSKKEKRAAASADWHPAGDGAVGHM
jgi:electron transfer DM13